MVQSSLTPKARIGKNCKIHGNCCIGSDGGYPDLSPVIGDNVDIGQGAQIIGNIKVADNVRIGAGAVVVKDVLTPGVTVVGVPAKEIYKIVLRLWRYCKNNAKFVETSIQWQTGYPYLPR